MKALRLGPGTALKHNCLAIAVSKHCALQHTPLLEEPMLPNDISSGNALW